MGSVQLENDRVLPIRFNFGDQIRQPFGVRADVGVLVAHDGVDHIVGIHGLAVVERDPLPQFEDPLRGIRIGFKRLREFGLGLGFFVESCQPVIECKPAGVIGAVC